MSDIIIEVRDLGKKYIINHQQREQYTALRDVITSKVKSIGKKKIDTGAQEEFWALKDVSFDVKQGDKIGIIGRNGAGKSTLLKLMSRITEPTTGSIKIRGRVASLLEVGTGFHPELTGRENIFLNGAILGMGRQEIKKKFNEIVEFAEVEKFLDTPVKRYSSGMYVRLAFSVAAHLEPEILIVDEVLAVGDAQFQKKCLGKMGDVSKEGRTVLFVSHNMGMISSLCNKCVLLNKGCLEQNGNTSEVMKVYQSNGIGFSGEVDYSTDDCDHGDNTVSLKKARLIDSNGQIKTTFNINEEIIVEMEYVVHIDNAKISPNIHVCSNSGDLLFISSDTPLDINSDLKTKKGTYISACSFPANFFNSESYSLGIQLSTMERAISHYYESNLLNFEVTDPIEGTITRGKYAGAFPGVIRPALKWHLNKI